MEGTVADKTIQNKNKNKQNLKMDFTIKIIITFENIVFSLKKYHKIGIATTKAELAK